MNGFPRSCSYCRAKLCINIWSMCAGPVSKLYLYMPMAGACWFRWAKNCIRYSSCGLQCPLCPGSHGNNGPQIFWGCCSLDDLDSHHSRPFDSHVAMRFLLRVASRSGGCCTAACGSCLIESSMLHRKTSFWAISHAGCEGLSPDSLLFIDLSGMLRK